MYAESWRSKGVKERRPVEQRPESPRIDSTVFWIAAILSAVFVAWGIFFTESPAAVFDAVLWSFLVPNFGWMFILATFGFLTFALYLAFSRYGKSGWARRTSSRSSAPSRGWR